MSLSAGTKSVLVISSYRTGYPWSADVERGLHNVWRESKTEIATWVDYLDSRRDADWRTHFYERFDSSYKVRKFDLLVVIDDEAVEIWCSNQAMFRGIPVVFGGVTEKPRCGIGNSTGELESFNTDGLIRLGFSVRPNPPKIAVLTDHSALSDSMLNTLKANLSAPQLTALRELDSARFNLSEVEKMVAQLDPASLVFIASFQREKSGNFLPSLSTYRSIGYASAAPVIALSSDAGPGLLAGSKNSGLDYGQRLGKLALRVLSGEDPSSIPTVIHFPTPPQIEASELQRWGVSESVIPQNVEVLHANLSFFARYRNWIIGLSIFLFAQSALLIVLGFNILARRRAQRELMHQNAAYRDALDSAAAASESKSRFVANMSHELRTPLNGILGMSELLLDAPLVQAERSSIETIRSSANHLLVILNDILDVSQLESGRLKIVERHINPSRLIEEAVQLFQPPVGSAVQLRSEIEGSLPSYLMGDPARIRQILFNLIGNALKFTTAGSITVGAKYESGHLKLWVCDTGLGIPRDQIANIFARFAQVDDSSTRQHGGLGLGLYIAHELATRMSGTIDAVSEPGQGSCFTLELPLAVAVTQPEPAAVIDRPLELSDRKVLVVEDNLVNLTLTKRLLERFGCHVSTAVDGQQGVSEVLLQTVDLILMDLQMPKMDGLEATRKIRALDHPNAQVPIIALTASAAAGDRELCLAAGMNDHLAKPINRQALEAALSKWLSAPPESTPHC